MLFLWSGGKPSVDRLLNSSAQIANGQISKQVQAEEGGKPPRYEYEFTTADGQQHQGFSFMPEGTVLQPGKAVAVEFFPSQPSINRLQGGFLSRTPPLVGIFFWSIFVPGLLSLSLWILAVLRLRQLMTHGDVAHGEIIQCQDIPVLLPSMLKVEYSFRDRHAKLFVASHWVRQRSELGQRLRENPKQLAVIHSRKGKNLSRLVMADDFVAGTG